METIETTIGTLTVRELTAFETKELQIRLALIRSDEWDKDNALAAKKMATAYFERYAYSTGKALDDIKKLTKADMALLEAAYERVNADLTDEQKSDLPQRSGSGRRRHSGRTQTS